MIQSAPIPALIDYYARLRDDPSQGGVAAFGYSLQKISFRVVIETTGDLFAIQDARDQQGKKPLPVLLVVPGQSKPSGSGINPCFLWDNAAYLLGVKLDDPKPQRTLEAFEAFKQRHLEMADQIDDEHFKAVCAFLAKWRPDQWTQAPGADVLKELVSGFGVFQIRGTAGYVHQRPAVDAFWRDAIAAADEDPEAATDQQQSLISGRLAPIARLHEPKIKGVVGGQSSGAVLVGFNAKAYESYGKDQSINAPVAEDEAFQYCTALNHLLAQSSHRVLLGDTTVAFWSDRKTEDEDLFAGIFGGQRSGSTAAEDTSQTDKLNHFFDALRRGAPHEGLDTPEAPFYVLGLSPNAARISVRFWLVGTVGEFAERLSRYVRETEIDSGHDPEPLTARRLLRETARDPKEIPPMLAGGIARAILMGSVYPMALFSALLRRLRADQQINARRAGVLKAILIRNYEMEVSVALNKQHANPVYHMGRLFAALEKTQQDAMPGLNKTIKDGYFATASATPAVVFPRLIRMHQHHIEKLDGGHKVNREKLIQEICGHIEQFPAHLAIEQQGLFHIAYYHQRQDFFTKKQTAEPTSDQDDSNPSEE